MVPESRDLVRESVVRYFREAERLFSTDPESASRALALGRKLAMRHRFRIPRDLQMQFCKKCYSYLRPGVNATRRLTGKTITITCGSCGGFSRYGYVVKSR